MINLHSFPQSLSIAAQAGELVAKMLAAVDLDKRSADDGSPATAKLGLLDEVERMARTCAFFPFFFLFFRFVVCDLGWLSVRPCSGRSPSTASCLRAASGWPCSQTSHCRSCKYARAFSGR